MPCTPRPFPHCRTPNKSWRRSTALALVIVKTPTRYSPFIHGAVLVEALLMHACVTRLFRSMCVCMCLCVCLLHSVGAVVHTVGIGVIVQPLHRHSKLDCSTTKRLSLMATLVFRNTSSMLAFVRRIDFSFSTCRFGSDGALKSVCRECAITCIRAGRRPTSQSRAQQFWLLHANLYFVWENWGEKGDEVLI